MLRQEWAVEKGLLWRPRSYPPGAGLAPAVPV